MAITAADAAAWVLALVPAGGGIVFLLKWYDARVQRDKDAVEKRQADLQDQVEAAVEKRFEAQAARLTDMASTLVAQQQTINRLEEQLGIYVRYAGKLERLLALEAPHLELPELELPPMPRMRGN